MERELFDKMMVRVLELFPFAYVGEDADGQLVINTGLTVRADGTVGVM